MKYIRISGIDWDEPGDNTPNEVYAGISEGISDDLESENEQVFEDAVMYILAAISGHYNREAGWFRDYSLGDVRSDTVDLVIE